MKPLRNHARIWITLKSISIAVVVVTLVSRSASAQTQTLWDRLSRKSQVETESEAGGRDAQRSQPRQLKVIDRATSRRMTEQQQFASRNSRSQEVANGYLDDRDVETADWISDSNRRNHEEDVQKASYQHSEQRTYQSPLPNPYAHDVPPGYGNSSFQNQGRPAYSTSNDHSSAERLAPEEEWDIPDDSNGQPSMEHPDSNQRYSPHNTDHANEMAPVPRRQFEESISESFPNDSFPPNQHNTGTDYFPGYREVGRGYLQGGANFQGTRMQTHPKTATEKALELQLENEGLTTQLKRSQSEVVDLTRKLDSAHSTNRRQDEELKIRAEREQEMLDRVKQLTLERDKAIDDRVAAERRFNEQLKSVETMLDGVLVNELSDK